MRLGIVLPLEPSDARAGMLREVWRHLPAREGKGGRDSAIWSSITRHHNSLNENGFFVSRNTKDFASLDGNAWAPELASEVANYDKPLTYTNSPEKLFADLATAASIKLDSAKISKSDAVTQAVAAFVEDRQIYAVGSIETKLSGEPFLAAPVSATLENVSRVQPYIVAETTIAVAWTDWYLECHVGVMRRFSHGSYGQTFYLATGKCRLQLLLRIDAETGDPLSAEVTNSSACTLVSDPIELR